MTQYDTTPPFPGQPDARPLSKLALWSMILGIFSFCFPPLGLVALIMGIVGITKTSGPDGPTGKGFAIAGTSLGAVAILSGCLWLGIVLPAIGKARQAAETIISETQLRQIQTGMINFNNDRGSLPPADDWQAVLSDYLIGAPDDPIFDSPLSDGDAIEYVFVGADDYAFDGRRIMLYEDPDHRTHDGLVIVSYDDGRVERVDVQVLSAELAARGQTLQR